MAKAPRPGEVKTRLCPPLLPADAAVLYRCFLLDKIAAVGALANAQPTLAYTPADARAEFAALAPGFALVPQQGPDLGARLHATLEALLAAGHAGAVAVDSDTPTLPRDFLQQAVDSLAGPGPDVVLGPTEDGGYYLIGVRAAHRELFDGVPWSTPQVLEVTLRRAAGAGLRVERLPVWFDVDTPDDLERLRAALPADGVAGAAPETDAPARELAPAPAERYAVAHHLVEARVRQQVDRRAGGLRGASRRTHDDLRRGVVRPVRGPAAVPRPRHGAARPPVPVRRGTRDVGDADGRRPRGETLEAAAQRELAEESGYRAGRLVRVSTYHTSKSVVDETAHLFLAEDLTRAETAPDETEFIDVRPFPFDTVLRMVLDGEIVDGMTVIAVLLAARRRDGRCG